MATNKVLHFLLLLIVLLLAAHLCVQFLFPVGRYEKFISGSSMMVFDTRTGTTYIFSDGKYSEVNIVERAKKDKSQHDIVRDGAVDRIRSGHAFPGDAELAAKP